MAAINYLVAFSSLFALQPIYRAVSKNNHVGLLLSIAVLLASILQHLSETKHSLPGVLFSQYATTLLNVDRAVAVTAALYGILRLYSHPELLSKLFIFKAITGLLCSFVGENVLTSPEWHLILHPAWHYLAFACLGDIM